mmetsp:Transcript_82410/g.191416  ORF Transcript_82410/g.191416 Transcript_82410/m.191416 type:complete len:540 (+) Transcript_82410:58-1677(+)
MIHLPKRRQSLHLLTPAVLLVVCGRLSGAQDAVCQLGQQGPGCSSPFTQKRAHHWPRARGHVGSYGVTNLTGPSDLSNRWYTWFPGQTRLHQVTICGPLIDDALNLYVTTVTSIHKLSSSGNKIWEYPSSTGLFADCPSLMNGVLLSNDMGGHAFALEIDTGRELWKRKHTDGNSGDTGYVENHDGIIVYEAEPGSTSVIAVNATSGELLWTFRPDVPCWNLMAIFPMDGTVVFQDHDAKVYRLNLYTGQLIWKNGGNHVPGMVSWSDGGLMLGPNGVVYAVSAKSQAIGHHPKGGGGIHAYRLEDGSLLWEKHLLRPFFTWPVIGKLAGRTDLSVIAAIGANAYFPWKQVLRDNMGPQGQGALTALAFAADGGLEHVTIKGLASLMIQLPGALLNVLRYMYGWIPQIPISPKFEAEIYAYDAGTGAQQWEYKLPDWPYISAAGDSEGFFLRSVFYPARGTCLPAAYNAPTIDGNGVVYIGYHDGRLYALQDTNRDGTVAGPQEVSSFDTGAAFLHSGTAFAPGLMGVVSCDSLHVWRT